MAKLCELWTRCQLGLLPLWDLLSFHSKVGLVVLPSEIKTGTR